MLAGAVVLAPALALVLACPARAQDTGEYRQLVERLAARARMLAPTEPRPPDGERRGRLDTLTVGRLTLLFPPPRTAFVESVARTAWDSIAAAFGADTAALLPHVITLGGPGGFRIPAWTEPVQEGPRADTDYALSAVLGTVRDREASRWRSQQGSVGRWLSEATRAMFLASPGLQDEVVYTELATKPWRTVRACYDGDLAECHRALALSSWGTDTVALRYTPEERRRMVAWAREENSSLRTAAGTARCVEARVDSACVEVFQRFLPFEEPLSSLARATLLRTALEFGGDGAYGRLLASGEPEFLARLASVAGVPADTLLAAWHARILAAKPASMVLTRLAGWTAFLWAAIFALAATRSSRWRRD